MQTDAMKVLEKLKPGLIADARAMRAAGDSYEDIAGFLTTKVGVKFGRETVRRWFNRAQETTP